LGKKKSHSVGVYTGVTLKMAIKRRVESSVVFIGCIHLERRQGEINKDLATPQKNVTPGIKKLAKDLREEMRQSK
jgi:hypothetical protein